MTQFPHPTRSCGSTPPTTTPIVRTERSDWNRRIHPPIQLSSATASQAGCIDATYSADSSTNTIDELHERICAPYGTHVGDSVEDIAWAEWVVRFHHADLVHALPALFGGYHAQPPWPRRQAAKLAKCRALDLVHRLRIDDDAEAGLWQRRIDTTAAFRE
jgi:hypothetical protein